MIPGYSENEAPTQHYYKNSIRASAQKQMKVVVGYFLCNTMTSVIHICVLYPQSHT